MPRLVVTQARRVEDNSTPESTNGGHPVNDQQAEANPASPMTDIHDHPSYREIDAVFADSSNVAEFRADAVAVGRCGAADDDGCIRLMASGSAPVVGLEAAAIHLDQATALRLLGELAKVAGPAKTHDLTVRADWTNPGLVLIAVEDETDDYRLYLPTDKAKQLGRILGFLTPAQVAILAAELTGGAL